MERTYAERFWERVDRRGPDECWDFAIKRNWYAWVRAPKGKRRDLTHRVAWQLTHGPIPDGLFVCHKCDRPKCCNPSHLFLGTAKDNAYDRKVKGRNPNRVGENNTCAVLTEGMVILARNLARDGRSLSSISRELGVSENAIRYAVRGRNWSHLPGAIPATRLRRAR